MNLGFVGLGDQGLPIALRLAQSNAWSMAVWARGPASAEPMRAVGVSVAESLPELGAWADVLGICVTDDAAVNEVVAAVVPTMRPASAILVHSTVLPLTVRRLGEVAGAHGIDLIDAPVSGGSDAAIEGRMAVMVGGSEAALERVRPVLDQFARTVRRLGPIGAGEIGKIVNNVLMMANGGVLVDALESASEGGVDADVLLDVVAASSGDSYVLRRLRRHTSPERVGHVASLLRKDLTLFHAMTAGSGVLMGAASRYVEHLEALTRSGRAEPDGQVPES